MKEQNYKNTGTIRLFDEQEICQKLTEIGNSLKLISRVVDFEMFRENLEQSMNGLIVRSVGIVKASGIIGLMNLNYNLFRYEQAMRVNIIQIN